MTFSWCYCYVNTPKRRNNVVLKSLCHHPLPRFPRTGLHSHSLNTWVVRSAAARESPLPRWCFMAATSHSLKSEVEELVLEQIHVFKQSAAMDDGDLLEYHLRHYQIMSLYGQLDRLARAQARTRWVSHPTR